MKLRILGLVCVLPLLAACELSNVPVNAKSVELNKHALSLGIGDTEQLVATVKPKNAQDKTVTWSIDTETNAITLSDTGLVTAVQPGQATICVTTNSGGFTDYCTVSVIDASRVDGVSIDPTYLNMEVGQQRTITATVSPITAQDKSVSWLSSDETVATVSSTGVVNAVKEGTANISAVTTDGGFTAVCPVKVKEHSDIESLWDESQNSLRNGTKTLDFYSLNDFHGSTEYSTSSGEPGMTRLSTYFKSKYANNPDGSVFTSSGDMWQGSADSNITRGHLVVDWMNMLNCSAMALGNHEFDWTVDTIHRNQVYANFDFLACNIVKTADNQNVDWVKPYTTITRNGVHIGIIGAIGEGITSSIVASNVKGLTFANPNPYIQSWNTYLRDNGADVVIVLYHGSVSGISYESGYVVDGIFGGHTHTLENETIGHSPAIQAKSNGKYVGHINIEYTFEDNRVISKTGEYFDAYQACSSLQEDSETKTMYQTYLDNEIQEVKSEVVSTHTGGIEYGTIPYVYNQYAYKYFNDTYEKASQYNISFVWTNQARSAIPASRNGITYGDVYKALPFDNSLCLMKIKGGAIKNVLTSRNYGYLYSPTLGNIEFETLNKNIITNDNSYYYFLVINYIIESTYYTDAVTDDTYEFIFLEEGALPRNILKRYLNNYPSNYVA